MPSAISMATVDPTRFTSGAIPTTATRDFTACCSIPNPNLSKKTANPGNGSTPRNFLLEHPPGLPRNPGKPSDLDFTLCHLFALRIDLFVARGVLFAKALARFLGTPEIQREITSWLFHVAA